MTPWLLLPLVVGAGAAWRTLTARRIERAYTSRFMATSSGVVAGAESFTLPGTNGRALLLLHGSGDTPQTLRYLGEQLNAAGYTVYAPLLPGHGRTPRDFMQVSATEYLTAAREALDQLRGGAEWIGVVGLSMGGGIAAQLAAESPDVRALILLAAYLTPPPSVRWMARTSLLWGLLRPYLGGRGENSVHDPVARAASYAYGVFPPRALTALVETARLGTAALARVTVPTLVINSTQDNRIPATLAAKATTSLRAPAERHWIAGCGHVITVDYCKKEVAELVLAFLARHAV